jgi:outer membrane receptor protein involved in Fe transport
MMRYYLFLFLLINFLKTNAQELSGTVVDTNDNPVPFINVILFQNERSDQPTHAAISNQNGTFRFNPISKGDYIIEVSGLGFKTYRNKLSMPDDDFKFGVIKLKMSTEALEAVTVTAQKPVVDVQPDKTVLNVNQMATVAGDNTLELLRRAPGVRLDNNDNVIVEGKSGITYYINGRQTYLTGDDLNNYLRSLTSDDIESIELITQPSSKYDAAGAGGVINIVLKRIKGQGVKGNIASTFTLGNLPNVEIPIPDGSTGLGHRKFEPEVNPRANTSLNLTYRSEKWDFAGNLSNNLGQSSGFLNLYRFQENKIYDDRTNRINDNLSNTVNLRSDYRLDDKNTIGASINANLRENDNQGNNRTPIIDQNTTSIDSILLAPNSSDFSSVNLSTNLNYRYKDTLGNMLTADLDYGQFIRDTDNRQPNFYVTSNGEELSQRINAQETGINIDIYAAKADYETRLWGNQLSAGIKFSLVATDNDFDFFNVIGDERLLNNQRSNRFFYDEQIRAGYVNYSFDIISKKNGEGPELKTQIGLRAEQTVSKGDLRTAEEEQNQVVERDYLNWFPSGGLTYKPNRDHNWSLTYSRRIQRPNYNNLNPFEFQLNELSSSRGNPFLQPQYIDNLRISHTYKYKLTTSLSYSYISDFFARITQPTENGRNFLITQNVADQEIFNFSISRPFKINNKLNGYASAYMTNNDFQATDPSFISLDQFTYGGYAQLSYAFENSWTLETSGFYSGPTVWGGTYQTDPLGSLSLALEKQWGNWTAKVNFSDILYTRPWNATTVFPGVRINATGGGDSRQLQFYLSYSFGQDDVKKVRDREGSSKDEQDRI